MNVLLKCILHKIVLRIASIGDDPKDSEETRFLKRIYIVSMFFATLVCGIFSLIYALLKDWLAFYVWVGFTVVTPGFILLVIIFRRGIEWIGLVTQTWMVVGSFLMAVLLGGFLHSDGIIFMGLIAPIYALIFPKRRRAIFLFALYALLIVLLVILQPYLSLVNPKASPVRLLIFGLFFLIAAIYAIYALYFFVNQRDQAYMLLGQEKEKSETLLRRIEKDLEQAAQIQKDFLPKKDPQLENYEINGINIPCYQVGGDYFDFIPIDSNRLGIVIADVSGKGIGASLLMASLRAALLAEVHPGYRINEMVSNLNDFVYKSSALNSFITFFYGELSLEDGELRYVNAGHSPPCILSRTGKYYRLESSGFGLGMFPSVSYQIDRIHLRIGDVALLFTDGIPDSRNKENEDFAEKRLIDILEKYKDIPASKLSQKIFEDIDFFTSGAEQLDDMTMIILKRTGR